MPDAAESRWPPSYLAPSGVAASGDGTPVAYYDLGGRGRPLLLVHATGFCAATLAPLAGALGDGFRAVAVDERGHGASGRPPGGDFEWHGFAADVLAVVDELGLEEPLGFGHSCGGAALLLAEEARPGTFAGLYCFEPIVYPGDLPLAPSLEGNPLAAGALRRRERFASRRQALENFSSKAPFDRLHPAVLAGYVDNGFGPDPDGPPGALRLRCRREDEAAVYARSFSHDAYANLERVGCRVTLACGSETDSIGPELLSLFAARLARAEEQVLPGLGHFGPLEDPAALAAAARASSALAG